MPGIWITFRSYDLFFMSVRDQEALIKRRPLATTGFGPRKKILFLILQQTPNTMPMLCSQVHWWRYLHPSNCCTTKLNLTYGLQLITSNRTAPRYWHEDSDYLHTFSTHTPHVLSHSRQEHNCLMPPSCFNISDTLAEPWLFKICDKICPKKCLSLPSMWCETQPLSAGYGNACRCNKTSFSGIHWNFTGVIPNDVGIDNHAWEMLELLVIHGTVEV
jgi:hypothetical protein